MPNEDDILELLVDSLDLDPTDATAVDEDLDEDADEELEEELTAGLEEELDDPVEAALRRGAPLLLLHKSHQHSSVLPQVADDILRRHGGALQLGTIAPMPRMSPTSIEAYFDRMSTAPVRIADPECFARDDSFGSSLAAQRDGKPYVGSTSKHWSYFTDVQKNGHTETWVRDVLDAQRSCGATVLLTPGLWGDPATAKYAIATMRQHAEWSRRALDADEKLAVNVTIPASWLTTGALRDRLLDEIVDMDEQVFYLRVRWPLLGQPYGQLIDRTILDGYLELAAVFDDNDKVLILPNTGLTGWVGAACGAHGFSTGIGSGERAFADTRVIKINTKPRPAPTRRVFAHSLLHVVDVTTAEQVDSLTADRCHCRFCRAQRRLPAGQWDKALAGAHYLRRVGDMTAGIATNPRGRRVAARRATRDARRIVGDVSARLPLVGANEPKHLELWADLLR
ncbi:hypothetical protein ACFV9C_35970 [Kribbella sp. NPDC059898]|uniref:hypothetical protein n=1 Tax=Kribbella sp. NPDC059898 TaxID=3346995 RepID=UPI00365CBCE9